MKTIIAGFLLLAALAVLAVPDLAVGVSGLRRLAAPSAEGLDRPPAADDREAPRFLVERDEVEVVVHREITVGDLLELYQLDAYARRQIAEQLGVSPLPDSHPLAPGESFRVTLTPPAEGAP